MEEKAKDTESNQPVDRRAELLKRRAEREAAVDKEREAYDLAVLEIEDRLSEGGALRGRQFEIIELFDLGEAPIAVRCNVPGIQAMHKAFVNSKTTEADVDAFVTPCLVSPDASTYRAIVGRRPQIAHRCAEAVIDLLGMRRGAAAKKY